MEKKLINYEEKKLIESVYEEPKFLTNNDIILSWISITNKRRALNRKMN